MKQQRLKYLVGINRRALEETTDPSLEFQYIDIGSVGRGRLLDEPHVMTFANAPSRARRLVRAGDTIISTVRTYLRAVWPVQGAADNLVVSTGFAVLTPGSAQNPRYLGWLAQSDVVVEHIAARSVGVSYPAINATEIGNVRVPHPSLAAQRAIADYLDTETAQIDALIEKKQRMVELLEQRSQCVTTATILGDFGQQGVPSRSGFFRVVPAGWGETTLRHLGCEVQTGPFGSQLHSNEYVVGGWPVVNPMNLVDGSILAVETMTVSDDKRTELARHILHIGDVVFGRRGEMGRAGLVDSSNEGWLCGTGSLRLRLRGARVAPEYLKLLLETAPLRAYFELSSVGSTMDNLNSEIVLACPVLLPDLARQRSIITKVEEAQRVHRFTQAALRQQIDLLSEHRQALITAAVTGGLDIPGVAA